MFLENRPKIIANNKSVNSIYNNIHLCTWLCFNHFIMFLNVFLQFCMFFFHGVLRPSVCSCDHWWRFISHSADSLQTPGATLCSSGEFVKNSHVKSLFLILCCKTKKQQQPNPPPQKKKNIEPGIFKTRMP